MKCPECKNEMEKGVVSVGNRWAKEGSIAQKLNRIVGVGPFVYAWRCPKCGKVELQTEPDK